MDERVKLTVLAFRRDHLNDELEYSKCGLNGGDTASSGDDGADFDGGNVPHLPVY